MARIELKNVGKSYGQHNAVRGLDMTINDGELLVLLGPSGCGKSTTMNMIAGLEETTSGQILFDGRDVTTFAPYERNVAMVFQSSLLYPHLSAKKNIEMSLLRSRMSATEVASRVNDAAAIVNVTHLLEKFPSQLSGGERQRVATAKAIVRQPKCFLLDEPLSALDASLRLTLRSELVNLQKRLLTTMIFVTHDQVEAMTMGDRIGVMRAGKLEQIGTPTEIYNRPATLFVAGFVGAPPMNLLEGSVAERNGVRYFVNQHISLPLKGEFAFAAPQEKVVFGIRPHQMRLGDAGSASIPLTVYAIEQLGNEAVLIGETPSGSRIRVIVEAGFNARVGEVLHATADTTTARIYDPVTEGPVAITGGAA